MESAATFDQAAHQYDLQLQKGLSLSGESSDYFVDGRVSHLRERLASRGFSPKRVLDFGCGVGNAMPTLCREFSNSAYIGYDCSQESIAVARSRFDDQSAGQDAVSWCSVSTGLKPQSFDLAYTSGVFHHIPPDARQEELERIQRSLLPGGYFAFFENNPWNPGTRWVMSRIPFDRDAICLSVFEARRRLESAGFDIAETRTLFFLPGMLGALRFVEPWLSWTMLGAQYLVLARKPVEATP
ncbi:MAG: trans-aconitate 2-methyltransferase [Pirellulaceae bacterium]